MNPETPRHPRLIVAVIVLLALIEPVTHFAIHCFPPEGAVPTGMHIGDSAHHLLSMRSFWNGFDSPFATCKAPQGPKYVGYFATPFFLMYGVAGFLGHLLHLNEFLYLGMLNGLGGALYLWMAWRLLRVITPKYAETAFILFALGGGLGGIAYIVTGVLGLHGNPLFEANFTRFAWSDLIEGQRLSPWLLLPRFYYTLPLALGLAALAIFVRTEQQWPAGRTFPWRPLLKAGTLIAPASFLNMRLGPMLWMIAVIYLAAGTRRAIRDRVRLAVDFACPIALGVAAGAGVLQLHPHYSENVAMVTQGVMRLLPFLSVTLFFWFAAIPGLYRAMPSLPAPLRVLALGFAGYLAAYLLLFSGYQGYYGNWLQGGDTTAPLFVSDPALAGAVLGVVAGGFLERRSPGLRAEYDETAWVGLWLLVFLTLALGAFGLGWFQRFTPQRFMILLGLPLAVVAARGLETLRPVFRWTVRGLILCGGICSILVSTLFFQGSWWRTPGQGPFAYLHYAFMKDADVELLAKLPPGTVVVPMWSPIAFGEVVSLRPGARVLGGPGAMNIGDQRFGHVEQSVERFFSPDTADAARRAFARYWCVEYVYCPDTCPVEASVRAQLGAAAWLEPMASRGDAALFRVRPEAL